MQTVPKKNKPPLKLFGSLYSPRSKRKPGSFPKILANPEKARTHTVHHLPCPQHSAVSPAAHAGHPLLWLRRTCTAWSLWPLPMQPLCQEEVLVQRKLMPSSIRWCLGNCPNSPRKQGTFTVSQLLTAHDTDSPLSHPKTKTLLLPGDSSWPPSHRKRKASRPSGLLVCTSAR